MRVISLVIALIIASAIQVGYIDAAVVLSVIYSVYLFYGFRMGAIGAVVGGLLVDGARAGFIGVLSVLYLVLIGAVEMMTSSRDDVRRAVWVDAIILMILAIFESMLVGFGVWRVINSGVVFLGVYMFMSAVSGGGGGIIVRRRV